jgi:hypothetical protein
MMARGGKSAICSQNALMPHVGHEIYGIILNLWIRCINMIAEDTKIQKA